MATVAETKIFLDFYSTCDNYSGVYDQVIQFKVYRDSLFSIATYKISKMAANMATKIRYVICTYSIVFILLYLQQIKQ